MLFISHSRQILCNMPWIISLTNSKIGTLQRRAFAFTATASINNLGSDRDAKQQLPRSLPVSQRSRRGPTEMAFLLSRRLSDFVGFGSRFFAGSKYEQMHCDSGSGAVWRNDRFDSIDGLQTI